MSTWGFVTLLFLFISPSHAWEACGNGMCPNGNTCCIVHGKSFCVSGSNYSGACCSDNAYTGCGEGFECASETRYGYQFCERVVQDNELPESLPRYRLCSLPNEEMRQMQGIQIVSQSQSVSQLAYLSTMAAIDSNHPDVIARHLRVETLVIMVHGSARNVDDYLCTTSTILKNNTTMMLIAPWFAAPEDNPNLFNSSAPVMVWDDGGVVDYTWRYGADALNANVSSYAAMDAMLERVVNDRARFSSLKRIVVAGHSAGGQYVQRWALLSPSRVWDDPTISIRAVVANPKGYAFLDERRYVNGSFDVPPQHLIDNCSSYNEWQWGLGEGELLPTPYKDKAIEQMGGVDNIVQRYATIDVIYLVGELDILPNGLCMEQLQGPYRKKRSEYFFQSLQTIYGYQVHHRLVVSGVNHDHGLMYQSPEGQQALFGTFMSNIS